MLVRREDLCRLCHEAHAAEQDVAVRHALCLDGEHVGIAHMIGDLRDLTRHVAVGEDAEILFFFQTQDLLLHIINVHVNTVLFW